MRKLLFLLILLLLAAPAATQYVTTYTVDTDPEGWSPTTCTLTSPPVVLLYHNGTTVELCTCQSSNWTCSSAIATPPAGSTTEVQFNSSGAFGADSDWTYNSTRNTLTVGGHEFGLLDDLGSADTTGMLGLTDGTGTSPFNAAGRAVIAAQPSAGASSDVAVITGQGLLTLFLDTSGTATSFNYDRDGDGTYETTLDSTITMDPDDDGTAEFSLTGSAATITEDLTVSDGTAADWTMTFNDDDQDATLMWDESEESFSFSRFLNITQAEDLSPMPHYGIRYPVSDDVCSGDSLTGCDVDGDCSGVGGTCSVALFDSYAGFGIHRSGRSATNNRKDYVYAVMFNENPGASRIDTSFFSWDWTLEATFRNADGDYLVEQNWDLTDWGGTKRRHHTAAVNMGSDSGDSKSLATWEWMSDPDAPGTTPRTFRISHEDDNHGYISGGDFDNADLSNHQVAGVNAIRVIDNNLPSGTVHGSLFAFTDIPSTFTDTDLSQVAPFHMKIDWESSTTGTFADMFGALIDTNISGSNANSGMTTSSGAGLYIDTDFTSGSAAKTINNYSGIRVDIDSSGANAAFGSTMYHIRLNSPTAGGNYPDSANRAALRIDDQGTGETWDVGIDIDAIDASGTANTNIAIFNRGGDCNNGSMMFGGGFNDVLWWNQSTDIVRISKNARPDAANCDTAGVAVVTGTGAVTHGVTAWGDTGNASFDTGTEVCSALGMTCQTVLDPGNISGGPPSAMAEVACGSVPTGTASGYFTALCY